MQRFIIASVLCRCTIIHHSLELPLHMSAISNNFQPWASRLYTCYLQAADVGLEGLGGKVNVSACMVYRSFYFVTHGLTSEGKRYW